MQVREVVYLGSIQCLIQAEGRGEAQLEGLRMKTGTALRKGSGHRPKEGGEIGDVGTELLCSYCSNKLPQMW